MTTQRAQPVSALDAKLKGAIAAHGLSVRQVTLRLPERIVNAAYRVLAGTTRDPRTSTLFALCRAIDADPDELLGHVRPTLTPDVAELYDEAVSLDEADRWLLVGVVRAVARRRPSP